MAAISFHRINRAAIAQRRTQKKLVTITTIFYGLAMLLFSIDTDGVGGGLGIMLGMCGFICGFVSFEDVFKDLHNRQQADISLSMPMTGTERFLSKILCCFYVQIIPALICGIVAGNISFLIHLNEIGDDFVELWSLIVMLLAAEMFMLAMVSLCSVCCGTRGESVFFTFLLVLFQGVIPPAFLSRIFEFSSGIDFLDSHTMKWNLWGMGLFESMNETNLDNIGRLYFVLFINIVISIAILFISCRIYAKRDAKIVGTPVANKPFFEIMMFCGVMLIYLATFFSEITGWGILIAAIAYIIINIIVSRKNLKANNFFLWIGKFAIITFIFVGIMSASIATGGFGYINTKPDIDLNGSSITVTLRGYYGLSQLEDKTLEFTGVNLTDKQCREVINIFQKHIKKGRKGVADTLTDGTSYPRECTLFLSKEMSKNIAKEIGKIPGCTINNHHEFPTLQFNQSMNIDVDKYDEIRALGDELLALPYLDEGNNY